MKDESVRFTSDSDVIESLKIHCHESLHRRTYLPQEQDKDGKMALIHGRSNERSAFWHALVIS